MGFGDELLTSGIVRKAHLKTGKKVLVGDGEKVIWSEVFDHNPRISREITPDCVWVKSVKGNRPYIDYARSTPGRMVWKPWKAEPGELYFSEEELRWTETDFVYIEPNVKGSFGGNKDWGFEKWQAVVDALPLNWIQGKGRPLRNVLQLETRSFRDACALLSRAFLFVGTDGGMHHAAAALGLPAVVVWGGLIGPNTLGYDFHTNLCKATSFCGSVTPCLHCRQALDSITPDMVVEAIEERSRILATRPRRTPLALCQGAGVDLSSAQAFKGISAR